MSKQFTVYTTDETYEDFTKEARKLDRSGNWLFNKAMEFFLDDDKYLGLVSEVAVLQGKLDSMNKILGKVQVNGGGGVKPVSALGKSDEQIIMLEKKTLQSFDRIRLVDVRDQFVGTRTDLLNDKLDVPVSREEYLEWVEEALK